ERVVGLVADEEEVLRGGVRGREGEQEKGEAGGRVAHGSGFGILDLCAWSRRRFWRRVGRAVGCVARGDGLNAIRRSDLLAWRGCSLSFARTGGGAGPMARMDPSGRDAASPLRRRRSARASRSGRAP